MWLSTPAAYKHAKIKVDRTWCGDLNAVALYSERDKKIPVTLDLLLAIANRTSPFTWVQNYAFLPKISDAMRDAYYMDPRKRPSCDSRFAMDLLYDRALHEGLVK
ncbi:prohibitin family protein [Xanthomonas phage JGB6]|nr:prohibitin family protein [Xanthomonas phage JGB6]